MRIELGNPIPEVLNNEKRQPKPLVTLLERHSISVAGNGNQKLTSCSLDHQCWGGTVPFLIVGSDLNQMVGIGVEVGNEIAHIARMRDFCSE